MSFDEFLLLLYHGFGIPINYSILFIYKYKYCLLVLDTRNMNIAVIRFKVLFLKYPSWYLLTRIACRAANNAVDFIEINN